MFLNWGSTFSSGGVLRLTVTKVVFECAFIADIIVMVLRLTVTKVVFELYSGHEIRVCHIRLTVTKVVFEC